MGLVMAANHKYLYASASSDTLEVAVKNVINLLSTQIKNTVDGMTEADMEIVWFDGDVEHARSAILALTTSNAKLRGPRILTVKVPDKKNSQHTVFAYIEQSKIDEIYDEVKGTVLEKHEAYAIGFGEEVESCCYYVDQHDNRAFSSLFEWGMLR